MLSYLICLDNLDETTYLTIADSLIINLLLLLLLSFYSINGILLKLRSLL